MPNKVKKVYFEMPEGYEPQPFEPVTVRNLMAIRTDFDTDPEQWLDDLIDTLTEIYMPAEELYQQEENLRMMKYELEHTTDEAKRKALESGIEDLINEYAADRVKSEEQYEAALNEELRSRYYSNLNILNGEYQPVEDLDELEDAISEERLLKGYEPEPYVPVGELKSVEEQREIFEIEDEETGRTEPVDEEEWAKEMQAIIKEQLRKSLRRWL